MTPTTSAPEKQLIAGLPPTMAGLWTAIAVTHDVAEHLVGPGDPSAAGGSSAVVTACAQAAECLAVSHQAALPTVIDPPPPRALGLAEGLPLVSALTSGCIDLAVDLLGNEEEPLTPVEVLAVTRCVTALCAARSLAQAGPA
jgi:hypothetical protein